MWEYFKDWRIWCIALSIVLIMECSDRAWAIDQEWEYPLSDTTSMITRVEVKSDFSWLTWLRFRITF